MQRSCSTGGLNEYHKMPSFQLLAHQQISKQMWVNDNRWYFWSGFQKCTIQYLRKCFSFIFWIGWMALSITCRDNLHFCSCKLSIFVEYHTLSLHTSVTPGIHLFTFGSPFYFLARPKIARKLNSWFWKNSKPDPDSELGSTQDLL